VSDRIRQWGNRHFFASPSERFDALAIIAGAHGRRAAGAKGPQFVVKVFQSSGLF
jgi:hypothetical protein